jgi:hypothetical protein
MEDPLLEMPKLVERGYYLHQGNNKMPAHVGLPGSQVSITNINQCGVVLPPVLGEAELEPCGVVEGWVLPGAVVPGVVVFGVPFGAVDPGVVQEQPRIRRPPVDRSR